MVAQMDSNVNSTIAATTGLDSVAMKALAFVTTLFLPPTFVAVRIIILVKTNRIDITNQDIYQKDTVQCVNVRLAG
jgi:hypothetical protein